MSRVRWLWLLLCLVPGLAGAQSWHPLDPLSSLGLLHARDPIVRAHPFAFQLLSLWRVLPGLDGGPAWYDSMNRTHGTLVAMGAGAGWHSTMRPGATGEMVFDGTGTVTLGDITLYDFPDTTFTVSLWFRSSSTASQYFIARRRGDSLTGGWFIRLEADGTVRARLLNAADTPAADRGTATTGFNDGLWHHVAVVFTTDTVTLANNNLVIYLDGQLNQGALTDAANGPYGPCTGAPCPVTIGATSLLTSPFFGALDDLRILSRSVSALEVQAQRLAAMQGDPGLLHRSMPQILGALSMGSFAPWFQ